MELAWDVLDSNEFGTKEFIKYAKTIGTEPYFSLNLGAGTIKEAQRSI